MKVEGIYDCESDYDSDQAEAEDVPGIVTSTPARARSVFSWWEPVRRSASLYSGANWSGMNFPLSAKSYHGVPPVAGLSARGGSTVMVTPCVMAITPSRLSNRETFRVSLAAARGFCLKCASAC
jgi:hypothetical protein